MKRPNYNIDSAEIALTVMRGVRSEVQELMRSESPRLIDMIEACVPYATIIAEVEGHNDMQLVLERELDL